ncbi:MAG: DUF6538 domain-containing protein, partial [Nitrospiraceae bacterium]
MVTIFFRARSGFRGHRSSYYARLFVPSDLRAILSRSEIQKSLGTDSYREARVRSALWGG